MDKKVVFLIDGQTFYASVEKSFRPELADLPVAIADPERKSGIILAACPVAKAKGVTTAERVSQALVKCPELIVIRPRMGTYIQMSLLITQIFERHTDLVEPYSIDEQFLDVTGSLRGYASAEELAYTIQEEIRLSVGVHTRVGIGPTKVLAKMATDNFAKRMPGGIFRLDEDNMATQLWPLPVQQMFMVNTRMARHFYRMGLLQIGDIARLDQLEFRRRMRLEMGKQSDIQADYYWQTACGIDPSPVTPRIRKELKSISHGKALRASLYRTLADIEVVLLELVVEVCRRCRRHGYMGRTVCVGAVETDGDRSWGFSRQLTLPEQTCLTHEVAAAARSLFIRYWSGSPISRLYLSLNAVSDDHLLQLTLFDDREKVYRREKAIDGIKNRYGSDAILNASSLLAAGVARERAGQIGGHYK